MKKYFSLFLCICITLMFTSCATILTGTKQNITINSNVNGAKVFINNAFVGTTPYIGTIKKHSSSTAIKVSKTGYEDAFCTADPSLNLIILLSGAYCSTTDFATGGAWKYDQSNFYVALNKISEE